MNVHPRHQTDDTRAASAREWSSPDDQRVTWVELFFDLVFVFSVTQTVALLAHDLDWLHVGRALLLFWLVWWAWTQFTWTLNWADTTHGGVELVTMLATGIAFVMAMALPDAFGEKAMAFAVAYVLGRGIGLTLQLQLSRTNAGQGAAARAFALTSAAGMTAVIAGAWMGGTAQYVAWGAAIVLDLVAAMLSARSAHWNLHPEHFAERHGLFMIIALGETLIVAGASMVETEWTLLPVAVVLLVIATTCALWWCYFPRAKAAIDAVLEDSDGERQSALARDAYSLLHFVIVCGVIAYAAAVEQALAHPNDPLGEPAQYALAAGLLLYHFGIAAAHRRACGRWLPARLLITVLAGAALLVAPMLHAVAAFAIALAAAAAVAATEQRRPKHGRNAARTAGAGDPQHAAGV